MIGLVELARPVFARGLELGGTAADGAEALKRELSALMGRFEDCAAREGHSPASVEEAGYALMAWLDESVFATTSISIGWLEHSLVLDRHGDPAAGSGFYQRLERLHRRSEMEPALAVYARCLILGFRGRFRSGSRAELDRVLGEALGKERDAHPEVGPVFRAKGLKAGLPRRQWTGRRLAILGGAFFAISVGSYAVLAWLAQSGG